MKRFRTFRWGGSYGRVGFVFALALALAAVVWSFGGLNGSLGGVPQAEANGKVKIESLTLKYHSFGLGSLVNVELLSGTNKAELVWDGSSDSFTVQKKAGEKRVGSNIELKLTGPSSSASIMIHTSCSQLIKVGFFYGPDGDNTHEAESFSEFAQTGLNAALEITVIVPSTACGNVTTTTPTLTIVKTGSGSINAGQTASYTITVTNNGPQTATNVTLTDTLPAGVAWALSGSNAVNCSISGSVNLSCAFGSLANGATRTFTVSGTTDTADCGTLPNIATADATNTSPVSDGHTITVNCPGISVAPNLTLTKIDVPDPVNFGTALTYLLTVGNNGNLATSGTVTVNDTIPAGTAFVSAGGTGWSCSLFGGVVTCTRSDRLLAGSSYPAIAIVVNAPGSGSCGFITNNGQVSGGGDPGADPDATASQSTNVIGCPVAGVVATPTTEVLPAALPSSGVGPSGSASSGLPLPFAAGLALALASLVGWSAWRFAYSKRGQA